MKSNGKSGDKPNGKSNRAFNAPQTSPSTSWSGVAGWYDEYLGDADTYQAKVIWPNLKRILDPQQQMKEQTKEQVKEKGGDLTLLDLACGQGHFSFLTASLGYKVTGLDISSELISIAQNTARGTTEKTAEKSKTQNKPQFAVAPAHKLNLIQSATQNIVLCVLALQNIKELDQAIAECARVLKQGGKFVFVLNHPSFRIPKYSDWYFDEKKKVQSRQVWKYMQESTIAIDMNPGSKFNKKHTVSFHRPLQLFVKLLSKHGFAIKRLEEWCSHKKTEAGPRKGAEDEARKEIPMFMCIEASLSKNT